MLTEIICGLVIYRLFRRFFYDDHDDSTLDLQTPHSIALFSVATRLEKIYGGKACVGLRIPDADTGSRQNIDMVLVTKGEAMVICVQNFSGLVSINADGSWVSTDIFSKTECQPDPVAEVKRQVSILESYLEQRGATLPKGYLSCRVICSNPNFCASHSFPPEVVTYEQWVKLKPEPKSKVSDWIKDAFRGGKKEMQEPMHQKLNFIITTAPTWDSKIYELYSCQIMPTRYKKTTIKEDGRTEHNRAKHQSPVNSKANTSKYQQSSRKKNNSGEKKKKGDEEQHNQQSSRVKNSSRKKNKNKKLKKKR